MEARLTTLRQSVANNAQVESLDLDVHLNRGDALAGPGNLEVHISEVILAAKDIREHSDPVTLFDQPHSHAGAGSRERHTGIHQRKGPSAYGRHRGRAVGL